MYIISIELYYSAVHHRPINQSVSQILISSYKNPYKYISLTHSSIDCFKKIICSVNYPFDLSIKYVPAFLHPWVQKEDDLQSFL